MSQLSLFSGLINTMEVSVLRVGVPSAIQQRQALLAQKSQQATFWLASTEVPLSKMLILYVAIGKLETELVDTWSGLHQRIMRYTYGGNGDGRLNHINWNACSSPKIRHHVHGHHRHGVYPVTN